MNVAAITHNALAVRDVEVSGDFVYTHFAAHGAAFVGADVGEMFCAVVYALRGVAQNLRDAPLLELVGLDQLVTGVAAANLGCVGAEAVAAVVGWMVLHFDGALFHEKNRQNKSGAIAKHFLEMQCWALCT